MNKSVDSLIWHWMQLEVWLYDVRCNEITRAKNVAICPRGNRCKIQIRFSTATVCRWMNHAWRPRLCNGGKGGEGGIDRAGSRSSGSVRSTLSSYWSMSSFRWSSCFWNILRQLSSTQSASWLRNAAVTALIISPVAGSPLPKPVDGTVADNNETTCKWLEFDQIRERGQIK